MQQTLCYHDTRLQFLFVYCKHIYIFWWTEEEGEKPKYLVTKFCHVRGRKAVFPSSNYRLFSCVAVLITNETARVAIIDTLFREQTYHSHVTPAARVNTFCPFSVHHIGIPIYDVTYYWINTAKVFVSIILEEMKVEWQNV